LVGEDPSLTLTLQRSATRGGRQAICAAIDTLLLEDIMETGLMPEYLRQTRPACHPASLQLCTRLDRTI
jgi:hypoxanthine-guanine phosphoribosyltransferase